MAAASSPTACEEVAMLTRREVYDTWRGPDSPAWGARRLSVMSRTEKGVRLESGLSPTTWSGVCATKP